MNYRRLINFAGFVFCAGLIVYAYHVQYDLNVEPCPLCIFQRVGVIATGLVFLVAGLHNPKGWGGYVYAALIALTSLATIGVAADHLYVQSLPEGAIPSCGAPLGMLFKFQPWMSVIKKVLTGSGECHEVNWAFLGLAMPAWVAICALALGVAGVLANIRRAGTPRLEFAAKH